MYKKVVELDGMASGARRSLFNQLDGTRRHHGWRGYQWMIRNKSLSI
jgi:hypothetical protein